MSQGGEPLVVKSIGIDAVPLAGDKTVALMTLTDADGGEVEYAMDANGAHKADGSLSQLAEPH